MGILNGKLLFWQKHVFGIVMDLDLLNTYLILYLTSLYIKGSDFLCSLDLFSQCMGVTGVTR